MFKCRFGNFYLYKIWAFTVLAGAGIYTFRIGDFSDYFSSVLLVIIFGIMYCISSLIVSEILYKLLSKSRFPNYKVLNYTFIFSLITTNTTYYIFAGVVNKYTITFFIVYNICLIIGFFIFHKKPKTLTLKQNGNEP